jgi:VWFA-related protein
MQLPIKHTIVRTVIAALVLLLLSAEASTQTAPPTGQIHIPNRATAPLFTGKQGRQKTEISFDSATGIVTLKLLVQDPNGYFIPNIRRDNFVVYENGVRQENVTCDIEHAPVSLLILLEFGGRAPGFNRAASQTLIGAAEQFLDELGKDKEDRIALWKYGDKPDKLADFSESIETLPSILMGLGAPELSETNLYDATIFAAEHLRPVTGRKAIVLISSGVDTFSKTHYEDVIQTVKEAGTPIYAIALTRVLRDLADIEYRAGPATKMNWTRAEKELQEIATASGGRAYVPENTVNLFPIYDDLIENLKVRYVLTYRSSNNLGPNSPRSARVVLVEPKKGGPLHIVDEDGKAIPAVLTVTEATSQTTER